MKIDWKGLAEGLKNKFLPKEELREIIESTHIERITICRECPKNSLFNPNLRGDEHCTECGCNLALKTRCLSCKCPLDKWLALITEEDNEIIKMELNG